MKPEVSKLILACVFMLLLAGIAAPRIAEAQIGPDATQVNVGSGFSFQGYLEENGNPVQNDTCAFAFSLFDRAQGGNQLGVTQEIRNVSVDEGTFAVILNDSNQFGHTAFDGQARWLEITVDCGNGETRLDPRQELLAVPYAHSLRPGATITGNVPAETGILNLAGGDYGLRVVGAGSDGIFIDSPGGDGVNILHASDDGIQTWAADMGGVFSGSTTGVYAQGLTDYGPDLILSGIANELHLDGRIATDPNYTDSYMTLESNASVTVLLDADNSNPAGSTGSTFAVNNSGIPELVVNSSGVRGRRFFVPSNSIEGFYFNAGSDGAYVRTVTDLSPDLVLGGTSDTLTGDNGVIASDPEYPSSDIVLRSNDTVRIDLNANGDADDVGSFEVRDNNGNLLFVVGTNGDVCIGNC